MTQLGDYVVLGEIGRGGMGRVLRARHVPTGALRAVKVLESGDLELFARFEREAEALARVGPNVAVKVHELGQDGGRLFYAMELMPGGSLADRLGGQGRLPWREAAALVARLARAVERCHAVGVVHRDLKPANILFDVEGQPRLADFGCSRDLDATTLTEAGRSLGTPEYMAPEQVNGERGDERADVYALGVTLFELVAGEVPHRGGAWRDLLAAKSRPPRPLATRGGAPPALDAVIARALEPSVGRRTPSAARLAAELDQVLAGDAGSASRRLARVAAAAGALAAVAVAVAFHGSTAPPTGDGPATSPTSRPSASPVPVASPSSATGSRVASSGPPVDAALRAELEAGRARPGELEQLATTPAGREQLGLLADAGAVFPVEALRAARKAAGHEVRSLELLEAVAAIASGSDEARAQACTLLRRIGTERLQILAAAAPQVAAVARDRRRTIATAKAIYPFPGDELATCLSALKDQPRLFGAALAAIEKDCRDDTIADGADSDQSLLGVTIARIPKIAENFLALPPGVAARALFEPRVTGDRVAVPKIVVPAAAISALAAKIEATGDFVLATGIYSRAAERRETPDHGIEGDLEAVERTRSRALATPSLDDNARRFVLLRNEEATRTGAVRVLERVLFEAPRGPSGEPTLDPAALEKTLALMRLAHARAIEVNEQAPRSGDNSPELAHDTTALLLLLGRDAEALASARDLDPTDPLRSLLSAETITAADLERECQAIGDDARGYLRESARAWRDTARHLERHEPLADLWGRLDRETAWPDRVLLLRRLAR